MHLRTKIVRNVLASMLVATCGLSQAHAQRDKVIIKTHTTSAHKDSLFVTGIVKLSDTKQPLAGISVSVPDYSAAISDNNGNFRIAVPDDEAVLFLSGDGFQDKQVALKGKHTVTAWMYDATFPSQYDQSTLPFGRSVPKNFIPYSVQSFNAEDKWQQASTETPDAYLQGRIAGLNVVRHSGTPGIGANMTLNGINSLYATNQPLVVVDGVIYDNSEYGHSLINGNMYNPLSDIDIKDIDNITVLKSGNSTYGTKGANGVILITTARAEQQATRIDFAAYNSFNFKPDNMPVLDAAGYRTLLSELLQSKGLSQQQIQQQPYMNDDPSAGAQYYNYHNNTDWQNQVMKNSSNNNYYLKVTGGDNIAKYALSVGYLTNKGVLDNTNLNRYQMRFNGDLNLSKKLTAAINLGLVSTQQNLQEQGGESVLSPLSLSLIKAPFLSVHVLDETGKASPNLSGYDTFNVSNPVAISRNMQGVNKSYRYTGTVSFNYQFNNYFSARTIVGLTFDKMQEDMFVPQNGIIPDTLQSAVAYNRSGSNMDRFFSFYNNTSLSYNRTFNSIHRLQVDLGYRYMDNNNENEYGRDYNSATDEFVTVGMGNGALRTIGGSAGKWNWLNTYLHVDYTLHDKYFLSFNLAADGSSRFGAEAPDGLALGGVKYALDPSLAASWLISSEKFFSDISFVDNLKLRASFGKVGNDDIGNYTARQYYVSQNLINMEGVVRGNIGNPALEWETEDQLDFGLDASLFKERLSFSVDYFHNKTYNVITIDPTATETGIGQVITNSGTMGNNGINLTVNARIINSKFKWDLGINLGTYTNKVYKFPNTQMLTDLLGATYITKAGQAANLFYGYKTEGIFKTNAEAAAAGLQYQNADGTMSAFQGGDVKFKDVNGDHIIDDNDKQVIGNPNPKMFGGISNDFSWKKWTLSALFTFSQGNDIYDYTRQQLESMSGYSNQSQAVANRWRSDGQVTNMPRAAWGDPAGNARFSDRWIENGSYLRLRTVTLAYDIPLNTAIVKYIKVYATGNNLFTWTKYLGYDPEFGSTNNVFGQGIDLSLQPIYKTVQLGIRMGF